MPRIAFLAAILALSMSAAHAELLAPKDQEVYRAAFAAAQANDWAAAERIAAEASEQLPAKVLRWLELARSDAAPFDGLVAFADANPDWPWQRQLRERAEDASRDVPDGVLLDYFQRNHPTTPKGRLRFADMLAAAGKDGAATAAVRALWLATDLDPDSERAILERHASRLRPADHTARLDRLIWAGQRSAAGRLRELVPEAQRRLADARLGLQSLAPEAPRLVAHVPPNLRGDVGLLFEEARWDRRKDRLDDAARLFLANRKKIERPAAWWAERQFLARRLIDDGKDKLAYALLTAPGLGEPSAAHADDEFLSGWIAYRRIGLPKTGYEHFTRSIEATGLASGRARGAYWAGRAAETLGKGDASRRWLALAADADTTYYGQLAAERLGRAAVPKFASEPFVTAEDIEHFDASELVRVTRMLAEIGAGDVAKPFLQRLDAKAATPAEHKLVADLAETMHHLDVAIAAARRAGYDGKPLLEQSFPVIPIERDGVAEKPLILAIARAESSFDPRAVSSANARGLMQLEPETARRVAKSLSLPFSDDRLLSDAEFNLTLGSVYLEQMLDRFGGSYVLSLAAYNAGPTRVAQWLNEKGDPRTRSVDIVDWIELIPYNETRNYVERVLENLQVYRFRLGDRERAFTLAQDLRR